MNQHADWSLQRAWIKSALGLNILAENLPDALYMRQVLKPPKVAVVLSNTHKLFHDSFSFVYWGDTEGKL
jgi:hypothetical protein